ncbi:MAG TPA: ABC transporter permease [Anaerolineales bacterium]|nr:ABC transporter permease [Anaerolineales bacterium]
MRILHIAIKDLTQVLQQKKSALFLLIMPLLFTWLMGLFFSQNENQDQRLPVGLVLLDNSALSPHLQTLLNDSDTIRPVTPNQNDTAFLEEQVRSQKLAAVVIMPSGYSQSAMGGKTPQLTVIVDRNTPAGQVADRSIQLAITRLLGAVQAASLSAEAQPATFESDAARQAFLLNAVDSAITAWLQPRARVELQAAGKVAASRPGGFTQSSSGMLVFFSTIGMITPGYILLSERRSRTLKRMMTTNLVRGEIIAGHALAMFMICFVQVLLLTVFGQWVIGVNYWHSPGATILMCATLALWSTSLGLLISTLARDENQVALLVLGSTLIFGLLGGAFFPLDIADKTFATIGHLMPSAWAIDGFQNILLQGGGIGSVLPAAGVLLVYAAAVFALSVCWPEQN